MFLHFLLLYKNEAKISCTWALHSPTYDVIFKARVFLGDWAVEVLTAQP